ncbi:MAG: hypothetical protein M5U30_16025 [Burkholderiaceae bacterium]|nr:hypothetical protein [Burkholderiaceae bacterium]
MIDQARSGEFPEVALRLLDYFISRAVARESIDHRVAIYVAEALKEAIRRRPAGNAFASTETFIALGLTRARSGRPSGSGGKLTDAERAELNQEIARLLASGEKREWIQASLAETYGCSQTTIQRRMRWLIEQIKHAVKQARTSSEGGRQSRHTDPFVGVWLDAVDQCAIDLGLDREIVDAVARQVLPF